MAESLLIRTSDKGEPMGNVDASGRLEDGTPPPELVAAAVATPGDQ
ncbi:hypothetical protein [Kitasatospora sp. GP82]|nr:hypothetical protein [Kitasatospora sp. GP82]